MSRGFTLVELSIVLVIIGLLIGGILGGQELIRASELNSVTTDVNKYKVAVQAFKLKYNAIPGDMANATSYWGTASGGCPSGASTGTQTCNGDGNGKISTFPGTSSTEMWHAWRHLTNSGIVPGNFTAQAGSGSARHAIPGTNVPASKIPNGGYTLLYWGAFSDGNDYSGNGGGRTVLDHGFLFGSTDRAAYETYAALLSPIDGKSIDTKMDDGKPAYGNFIAAIPVFLTSCTTTNASDTADYLVTNANLTCGFLIKAGF